MIGVEPENVASYAAAIAAGKPVNGFKEATLVGVVIVIVFFSCYIIILTIYYIIFVITGGWFGSTSSWSNFI